MELKLLAGFVKPEAIVLTNRRASAMEVVSWDKNAVGSHRTVRSVSLVLPMYNEREVLYPLLKRIIPVIWKLRRRWEVQMIIVNDGSTDETAAYLERHFKNLPWAQMLVIHHDRNKGLGAAMATAFSEANGDVLCTLDADCSYSPEKIEAMIDQLEDTDSDIVTASPYHPLARDETLGGYRIVLSRAASAIYRKLAPIPLYCYTSFFRVYRREWVSACMFNSKDFLAVTEILVHAAYAKARITEFPLRLGVRAYGRSKMSLIKSMVNHMRLMLKMALIRLQFRKALKEQPAET